MGAPAAKKGDRVTANDMHLIQPPGPTPPVLVPHPFAGILDGGLSADVKVMGRPAATVGSTASNTPPHVPSGGTFVKPPTNQAKIVRGSSTVLHQRQASGAGRRHGHHLQRPERSAGRESGRVGHGADRLTRMANGDGDGRAFLGVGPAFPLRLDAAGNLALTALEDHVRQSIVLILSTERGERAMRPEFGAGLGGMVFAPVVPATAALIEHQVKTALIRNEPRIEVERVDVKPGDEPSVLLVDITYRVRRSDTVFNLVYPFSLERGLLP